MESFAAIKKNKYRSQSQKLRLKKPKGVSCIFHLYESLEEASLIYIDGKQSVCLETGKGETTAK